MNQNEFFKQLETLAENKWIAKINQKGEIRLKKPYGRLFSFDPITAICFELLDGKIYEGIEDKDPNSKEIMIQAGKDIKISEKTTKYICEASDIVFRDLNDTKLEKIRDKIANIFSLNISSEKNK